MYLPERSKTGLRYYRFPNGKDHDHDSPEVLWDHKFRMVLLKELISGSLSGLRGG